MMIVMKPTATEAEIQAVIDRIESVGAKAHPSRGDELTVIGAVGDLEHVQRLGLEGAPGVDKLVPILKPYKLASTQLRHGERSVFDIGGRKVGGEHFALIAGPCTFETAYRFTLDLTAIPVLKELSHLPVIVDPSHAAGRRDLVEPLSLAAAAAGADGIIVEVHPQPEEAICDGPQQLRGSEFADYAAKVEQAAAIAGKSLGAAV